MPPKEPNLLLKPHHLPYLASGVAITLVIAVFALSLSGFLPTSTLAVGPTLSGGAPADAATAVALDATVSIVSNVALGPASFGTFTSQTSGTSQHLSAIDVVSATTAWATGASGTMLTTTDSGSTWTAKTSGLTSLLSDVDAIDANTAYFVGATGVIQKTVNGGAAWVSQVSGTVLNLLGITCTDTNTCYVVGGTGSDFIVLKTTDGGANWTTKASGTSVVINAVGCSDANTCWLPKDGGGLAKTVDGGANFTLQTSGTANNLFGISVIDANTVYIVGASGTILKTTNGGSSWSSQTSGTSNTLNGIYCVSSSVCWAVGDSGTVLYTDDGGSVWASQTSNTSNALKGVHGASATSAWFVGNSGTLHVFGYNNVLLQANTGNTQAGSPTGSNLCTTLTLAIGVTLTCNHSALSKNTWYTFTLTTGVKSNTGDALSANVARAFRTIGAPALSTASITDASFAIATNAAFTADFDNPIATNSLLSNTWASRMVSTDLFAMHLIDANRAVAVGASGTTMRTIDSGSSWIGGTAGGQALNGLYFPIPAIGYAVGNSGMLQKTLDSGVTWTSQTSGTAQNLKAVHCADALTCWAVGAAGVILKTTNGGTAWTAQTSGTSEILFGVYMASSSTGYAVGNSGTVRKTTNGGTTWSSAATGATTGNHGDVFCTSATICWIASDTGLVYRTTDGGTNWTAAVPLLNVLWNSIHFASSTTGWVVGSNGEIYKSTDGGVNWTQQTSGVIVNLSSISFVSATTGMVSAASGNVLKTTDGGTTWSIATQGTAVTLNGVDMFAAIFPAVNSTGWAVGASGTILKTTNSGRAWIQQTSGTSVALEAVDTVSTTVAYAVGASGTILKTTNGGSSWSAQTSGTTDLLHSVFVVDANTAFAVGGTGSSSAIALKTTNGGTSWSAITPTQTTRLQDIYAIDANTAYAVGISAMIQKTTNGGTSWAALTGTSADFNSVVCSTATACIIVGSSGTILTTSDGTTWTSRTSGTTNDLRSITCMDASTCYAVGASGTILRTVDGGVNWTAQTSGTTNGLNAVYVFGTGADAWAVGHSGTLLAANRNVQLKAHANVSRSGAVSGPDECTSIALGNDGSGNSNRRITCTPPVLAPCTWYTLYMTGGANGLASTSGASDVLAADATRAIRTACATGDVFDDPTLSSLASEGLLTINSGSSTAASQATFAAMMRNRVTTSDGTVLVTVPQNAVFTRAGGGTFDTTAIALSDYTSSATNVPGTKKAVIQYGISGVSLTSDTAITIAIPVASTVTDSTVLDVYRDADGNFSDATSRLTTCTVSSSTCSFTTTSLSYFAATEPSGSPTQTDTTAPAVPTGLSCTSSGGTITCTWTDPSDTDLATLRILHIDPTSQATTLRGTVSKGAQTHTDSGTDLAVGTTYTVGIQAQDSSGNRSTTPTTTVTVSAAAPAPTDTTPPSAPTHLTATSASSKVTLTWTDPADQDLKLIRVLLLRGEATSIRSTVIKGTQTFTDSGADLIPGLPVTFALEAEDTTGNKSSRVTTTITVDSGTAPTSPPTTNQLTTNTNQPTTNTNQPITPTDTTPPAPPTQTTATVADDGKVTLTWTDPTDADLSKIRILLIQGDATTLRDTVVKGTQTFTDPSSDLTPGTTVTFALEAEDTAGNRSTKATRSVALPTRQTAPMEPDQPTVIPPEPRPPEPPPDLSALLSTAPCTLTSQERTYLADAFSRSQGRSPASGGDLQFLCSLRTDPTNPIDPTKSFPTFRNKKAEELALKNFVNFFRRPPSQDTRDRALPTEVAEKDWWAVKYMAYHLRLAPTARDLNGERTCLKLFLDRDVDLYKDGAKTRKTRGAPPRDLFDYDFIRACTYSGVTFVSAAGVED